MESRNESPWLTEENGTSCKKPPKFQAISRCGYALRFCLFAYAQPAEVRLRAAHAPSFAQNDRLIVCLRYAFVFRDVEGAVPYGFSYNSALCTFSSCKNIWNVL